MKQLKAFMLGMREFRRSITSNPGEDVFMTYERGRELAHRITFRRFDE